MPKRRKLNPPPDSDSSDESKSEDDNVSDSEDISEEEIDVEFEGSSPYEEDFHGMLNILHQLFVTLRLSASPLVDKILKQNHIGSTLKIANSDENELYGITTAVVMEKGDVFFKELTDALLVKMVSNDHKVADRFAAALNGKKTVYLMNERFINVPIQLAVPLLFSLKSDIEAAQSDAKSKRHFRGIEQILVVCKSLRQLHQPEDAYAQQEATTTAKGKKNKKKKKKKDNKAVIAQPQLEFVNAEEELFQQAASFQFSYSVVEATGLACGRTWKGDDAPLQTYRTVMLLPFESFDRLIKDVTELVQS